MCLLKRLSVSFLIYIIVALVIFKIDHVQSIVWQQGSQVYAWGCDFSNNDLTNVQTSIDQCGNACDSNWQCTHFTWTNYNGGTCWLKNGQVSQVNAFQSNDPSTVCGFANRANPSSGINWLQGAQVWAMGCDFYNSDLTNVQTSGEQCGNTCDANSQCTHFTWTNYNGGTCWLKSGQVSKLDAFHSSDPSSLCGFADRANIGLGN
jgi:hypothetical protein